MYSKGMGNSAGGEFFIDIWHLPRDTQVALLAAFVINHLTEQNELLVAENTLLRAENGQLKERVNLDSKTGLLTYEAFTDQVRQRTSRIERTGDISRLHGILFLDIDDFKGYNTRLGHPKTDILALLPVVHTIGASVRTEEGRDIVGRFGGEEFVAFLGDIDSYDNMRVVAERIRNGVNTINPYRIVGEDASLGISIGCAMLPQGGDLEIAIAQANEAMLRSKEIPGKNEIVMFDI